MPELNRREAIIGTLAAGVAGLVPAKEREIAFPMTRDTSRGTGPGQRALAVDVTKIRKFDPCDIDQNGWRDEWYWCSKDSYSSDFPAHFLHGRTGRIVTFQQAWDAGGLPRE